VKGFADLTLGHGGISDRAHHNAGAFNLRAQTVLLFVLKAHGNARCGNSLHTRCRTLVRNLGHVVPAQGRVTVVRASTRKRIVTLSHQLQHQLIRLHANAEQNTIVAVVIAGQYLTFFRIFFLKGRHSAAFGD